MVFFLLKVGPPWKNFLDPRLITVICPKRRAQCTCTPLHHQCWKVSLVPLQAWRDKFNINWDIVSIWLNLLDNLHSVTEIFLNPYNKQTTEQTGFSNSSNKSVFLIAFHIFWSLYKYSILWLICRIGVGTGRGK